MTISQVGLTNTRTIGSDVLTLWTLFDWSFVQHSTCESGVACAGSVEVCLTLINYRLPKLGLQMSRAARELLEKGSFKLDSVTKWMSLALFNSSFRNRAEPELLLTRLGWAREPDYIYIHILVHTYARVCAYIYMHIYIYYMYIIWTCWLAKKVLERIPSSKYHHAGCQYSWQIKFNGSGSIYNGRKGWWAFDLSMWDKTKEYAYERFPNSGSPTSEKRTPCIEKTPYK